MYASSPEVPSLRQSLPALSAFPTGSTGEASEITEKEGESADTMLCVPTILSVKVADCYFFIPEALPARLAFIV